jgi:hypothetical protein
MKDEDDEGSKKEPEQIEKREEGGDVYEGEVTSRDRTKEKEKS